MSSSSSEPVDGALPEAQCGEGSESPFSSAGVCLRPCRDGLVDVAAVDRRRRSARGEPLRLRDTQSAIPPIPPATPREGLDRQTARVQSLAGGDGIMSLSAKLANGGQER